MAATKAPNPTDRHVGNRVRMRRKMLTMSQDKLGDALGVTFQQVQKYEKGANRIGASCLQQISHILQVPVAFFFEGAPTLHVSGYRAKGAPSEADEWAVTALHEVNEGVHSPASASITVAEAF